MTNNVQYNRKLGIFLIIIASMFTAIGQLLWKLSNGSFNIMLIIGFLLYGCGAIFMILAFKYERVSLLHPFLSLGYVISIALGFFLLNEAVSFIKVIGTAVIIIGVLLVGGHDD
ncbi:MULTISPECIES: EamA family transporter [Bacillaceae]|uniref:EamA family transporter n=1 Tax=Bacillaceae TaxID=186817 RepID=UPI001FF7F291|nr:MULTISPECIES: EamA family transporter [Bacillaceae]MDT2044803.1 EamA family transporter [Priestia flexa]USY55113.1 EamA family transporter [Bacillus sp. 1780r2a1]